MKEMKEKIYEARTGMEYILIEECCDIWDSRRIPITASDRMSGPYPYYGANGVQDYVADYIFDDELVLLAEDGGNFGSKEKPIAYRVSGKCWVNNHAHVLKPKAVIDVDYLCYSLMFYDVSGLVNGATRQKLTQSDMRKMEIPLRTMVEQKNIVCRLNKLTELISLRKQQLAKLDELVKARFVEMFGDFEVNPKEFPVYHLCELCDVGSSKRIYQEEQSISGIPFLKVADLNELIDTGKYLCSTFIPLERYEQLLHKELTPKENDILITSRGTLGKCYIVQSDDEFYFQDGMISWLSNLSPKVSSIYISYLFAQPYIQKQIESLQAGSTVAYLSIAMLKKMNVILPPKKLQDDFATFVEHVDQQKQTVQQSLEKLELMKKALMQEYFG